MDTKAYLMQICKIDEYIKAKEAQRRRIRERLEYSSNRLSKEPRATTQGDKLCEGVGAIVDLQADIDRCIDSSIALQQKISKEIDMMEDNINKSILIRRYVNGEEWEWIAKKMGYSLRRLQELHSKALKDFKVRTFPHISA